MFVSTKSFRRNPKQFYFNDKELSAMGSKSERLVHQFLELLVSPTAVTPHTIIFSMTKKKQFVNNGTNPCFTTPNSAKTVEQSFLLDVLTSLSNPYDLEIALNIMFEGFLVSKIARNKNIRLDVFTNYKILNDFLIEVNNLKTNENESINK